MREGKEKKGAVRKESGGRSEVRWKRNMRRLRREGRKGV